MTRINLCVLILCLGWNTKSIANDASTEKAIQVVQKLDKNGKGHAEAIQACKYLSGLDGDSIPILLSGMSPDNVIANNWLRGVIESIVDKTKEKSKTLPEIQLLQFIADTSHAARGRELAFQLVTDNHPHLKDELVAKMLNDPSLELRRLAVSKALHDAKSKVDKVAQRQALRVVLSSARDKDQIDDAADSLKKLGDDVDLARHFGFIQKWQLIGPFDNTNKSGFDKKYPPEVAVNLGATFIGKNGATLKWGSHTTEDKYGLVDLNKAISKHMGAAAYAYVEFRSAKEQPADLRLGCINANKIWLNGKLLTANHVYHSGRGIDQYVGKGILRKGPNAILLKICQNEQTDNWAQDWQFQFRVCDALGTAILSTDRLAELAN